MAEKEQNQLAAEEMTAPSDLTEFNEETQTKPTESADFAVSETLSAKQGEDLSPDKKNNGAFRRYGQGYQICPAHGRSGIYHGQAL